MLIGDPDGSATLCAPLEVGGEIAVGDAFSVGAGSEIVVTDASLRGAHGVELIGTQFHYATAEDPPYGGVTRESHPQAWASATLVGERFDSDRVVAVTALVSRTSQDPGSYESLELTYTSAGQTFVGTTTTKVELQEECS